MATNSKPNDGRDEFRQLERRIRFGLVIAFLILLGALSLYFQFQFQYTIKETGRLNLAAIAESQRNTVDLFLQERVFNILSLFRSSGFSNRPSETRMKTYLDNLRQFSDTVIDVGFLDDSGIQIGYAGPFLQLLNKDYSDQYWYKTLLARKQDYFISDVYMGFRNKPHFSIGVKQAIEGQTIVLRATLDPDKFYEFLQTIHRGRGSESFIINQKGKYQVVAPQRGELFGDCDYLPPEDQRSGAQEIDLKGQQVLMAHAWMKTTDWALVISEPLSIAYAEVYRARRIMFISSVLIILAVIVTLWQTSKKLISRSREHAAKKEEMYIQLVHAGKMASLGELATGVAHEINNPLAVILATSGVIKDRLNPEFGMDDSPEIMIADLKTIDEAVLRARGITQQLLDYGHKQEARLLPTDVNQLLDEVLGGYKAREFELQNIEVRRHFGDAIPIIMADSDKLHQVILNLLNNAGDAIDGSGRIVVSTFMDHLDKLHITIADSGCGMNEQQMKRIFDPFYTTKEVGKGTGLGLSISYAIIESMGGTITVKSSPGTGSIFELILPIQIAENTNAEKECAGVQIANVS